jgi:hypothetical protein
MLSFASWMSLCIAWIALAKLPELYPQWLITTSRPGAFSRSAREYLAANSRAGAMSSKHTKAFPPAAIIVSPPRPWAIPPKVLSMLLPKALLIISDPATASRSLFDKKTKDCIPIASMTPLQKGVFFFLHFPLEKIDWDYHPFN